MRRVFLCATLGLVVAAAAVAQDRPGTKPPVGGDRPGVGVGGQFMRGSIVSVDPTGSTITLRSGAGVNAREQMFRVNADTRYFGADRQPLTDGLKFNGLKAGTDIWYRVGTGTNATMISDLRLFDPGAPNAPGRNKDRDLNKDRPNDKK